MAILFFIGVAALALIYMVGVGAAIATAALECFLELFRAIEPGTVMYSALFSD